MKNFDKVSVLVKPLQEILQQKEDSEKVRNKALEIIKESRVNPTSKGSMLQTLQTTKDPLAAIYNLILKYEGNGVIK